MSDIIFGYTSNTDSTDALYKPCEFNEQNATCEVPSGSYDAMFYGRTYIPLIYLSRQGETYVLENMVIDYNLVVRAKKVIVGENVTIKPDARLKLVVTDEVEIKKNVECQLNGKFEIEYE